MISAIRSVVGRGFSVVVAVGGCVVVAVGGCVDVGNDSSVLGRREIENGLSL